jgi:tetratricopeptide (TPR) repeat protein
MKPTTSLKRGLSQVRREWRAGRYDRALAEVNRLLEHWPDNPQLLTLWADLVQLQETTDGPSLEEVRAAYERAVELDEPSPAPLNELGHFLTAVEDDAVGASKCFDKAIAMSRRLLREALLGQAKALAELGRKPEALACLAEAYWLQTQNGKAAAGSEHVDILERLKDLAVAD